MVVRHRTSLSTPGACTYCRASSMTSDDAIQPLAPMPHPVRRRTAALSAGNFQPLIPGTAKPPLPSLAAAKVFLVDRERIHTCTNSETTPPPRGRALSAGSAPPPQVPDRAAPATNLRAARRRGGVVRDGGGAGVCGGGGNGGRRCAPGPAALQGVIGIETKL